MSVPSQKIANKSMTTLILLSQSAQPYRKKSHIKRLKSHGHHSKHKRKKRSGFIYFDSHDYISTKKQPVSTPSHNDSESPIDPSTIDRISPIIQDTFYTMSEEDPLSVHPQQSKSWSFTNYGSKSKQKHKSKSVFSYFKLKEMDRNNSDIYTTDIKEPQYIYYYDEEDEQQRIFYAQLNLSRDDIYKQKGYNVKGGECMKLDIVLNEYHYHSQSLPDIEHYFILLYYNIKQSSIAQLQQLWYKLYGIFQHKMKQKLPLPTIYINFQNGEQPTNITNIFNILYHQEFGIDLKTLKDAIKEYYYQWHPKRILLDENDDDINEPKEADDDESVFNMDRYLMMDAMETADEHKEIYSYNNNDFWSISDGLQFPSIPDRIIHSSPSPTAGSDIYIQSDDDEGQIFGFKQIKPKTAVAAGVFGVAATFGLRILGAKNLRFSPQ